MTKTIEDKDICLNIEYGSQQSSSDDKLISVVILCYQNYTALPNAVKSVLDQDYSRIELVISDDCSDFFNEAGLVFIIEKYRSCNLENYKIIRNNENLGTVRNLKKAMDELHGEFYITIGADDILYDSSILSSFVSTFAQYGKDLWWICGLTSMQNPNMTQYVKTYPEERDIQVLKRRNPDELFSLWARKSIATTPSMAFRKGIADLVGGYDSDNYFYMEDWPLFLKLIRKGITPVYIHKYIVKHSMGGISNHNTSNGLEARKKFIEEKYYMFQHEVDPYIDKLNKVDLKEYRHYMHNWMDRVYILECNYFPSSYQEKFLMLLKDFRITKWILAIRLNRMKNYFLASTKDWLQILMSSFIALIAAVIGWSYNNSSIINTISFIALAFSAIAIFTVILRFIIVGCLKFNNLARRYLCEKRG